MFYASVIIHPYELSADLFPVILCQFICTINRDDEYTPWMWEFTAKMFECFVSFQFYFRKIQQIVDINWIHSYNLCNYGVSVAWWFKARYAHADTIFRSFKSGFLSLLYWNCKLDIQYPFNGRTANYDTLKKTNCSISSRHIALL